MLHEFLSYIVWWITSAILDPKLFVSWVAAIATCLAAYGALRVIPAALKPKSYRLFAYLILSDALVENIDIAEHDYEGLAMRVLVKKLNYSEKSPKFEEFKGAIISVLRDLKEEKMWERGNYGK